jgi:hypothetical protein
MSTIEVNKITPVSGGTAIQVGESGDTITVPSGATITNSGTATNFTSYRPNAQPIIINGNMDVWQRGTGTVTTTGDYVGVDRFKISEDTDGSFSTERHTMSNAEFTTTGFGYALQADCTGTDASIGATQTAEITQKIEAQNLQLLQYGTSNAKNLTLAFWVKSSKTGTYCVAIRKRDSTSYDIPIEYTISSADTWEKKVINISPTAGSTSLITSSGGVIDNDNGDGLFVVFALAIGSNFHGTNNTWVAATKVATSNQVNWMDSTSNDFYLTGVQLEVGEYSASTLPSFQHETYAANLARCQRYYYLHADTAQDGGPTIGNGSIYNATTAQISVDLPVNMRTNVSISSVNVSSGYVIFHNGGTTNYNYLTVGNGTYTSAGCTSVMMDVSGATSMTGGQACWTRGNSTGAGVMCAFISEL